MEITKTTRKAKTAVRKTPKTQKVSKMQTCRHCGNPKINSIGLCHDCNRTVTFVLLQQTNAKKEGIDLSARIAERKKRLQFELELYTSMEDAITDNDGSIGKPRGYMKHFVKKY